jgi:hypothetical protein
VLAAHPRAGVHVVRRWRRNTDPEKLVEFYSGTPGLAENWPIQPARKFLPEWWKSMPRDSPADPRLGVPGTIKTCPAILDVFLGGWIMPLPFDIVFNSVTDVEYEFRPQTGANEVVHHPPSQSPGMPTPHGYSDAAIKFNRMWAAKTPPGYSLRISPIPLMYDPPLECFPAIVDFDYHPYLIPVFRYRWMGRGEVMVKAGTPLCHLTLVNRRDERDFETRIIPHGDGQYEELTKGAMGAVNGGVRLVRGAYKDYGKKWKAKNGVDV